MRTATWLTCLRIRTLFLAASLSVLALTLCAFAAGPEEQLIYQFKGGRDGASPFSSLVVDSAGNMYGTTEGGGGSKTCGSSNGQVNGCGTVYELTPPAQTGGHWTETVLHVFQSSNDGASPYELAIDRAGNLYGASAGAISYTSVIFQLSPTAGGAWAFAVLDNLDGVVTGLTTDTGGNLYVEDESDPTAPYGSVFELSPPAVQGESWTNSRLWAFAGLAKDDGYYPLGHLAFDSTGNIYGTTTWGGIANSINYLGCGTVFKLIAPTTQGGQWSERVLHRFTDKDGDGSLPAAGVTIHNGNKLYGTTGYGGDENGDGTVFEVSPPIQPGGEWTEVPIYVADVNSARLWAPVTFDSKGNLFSQSYDGADVFELSPPTNGGLWNQTVLYNFGCGGGCLSNAALIFNGGNRLYGPGTYLGSHELGEVYGIIP